MQKIYEYKGYRTIREYSEEDVLYYGKLIGIKDFVNFHGSDDREFEESFHSAVDDYLDFCNEIGKQPETPDYNEKTYAAKREVDEMINNPSGNYKTYANADEMMSDILEEGD